MPTSNPRINVTLSPSLDGLVARLAELQRVSKSSVLRELLETAEPSLQQVAALMEAASKARVDAKSTLSKDMQRSVNHITALAEIALEKAGGITRDLVSEAEVVRGRRPARAAKPRSVSVAARAVARGKDPLPSKRGVKR